MVIEEAFLDYVIRGVGECRSWAEGARSRGVWAG
jgi:hypothetical protein